MKPQIMKQRMFLQLSLSLILGLMASTANADVGVAITGGTTGLGGTLTVPLYGNYLNLRGTIHQFSIDEDLEEDGVEYDATLDLENYGLLLDWHPFAGGIRLTVGVVSSRNEITGTAVPTEPTEIGDVTFSPADIGTLHLKAKYSNSMSGYVGLGWGNAICPEDRITVSFDIGVIVTSPLEVDLEADSPIGSSNPMIQAQLLKELRTEEDNLEKDLEDVEAWPVISLGIGYRF
ncbi:hypothetical protein A9Q81_05310 [Gammaproteobacteria bacterium 42_54_T18]|nr:hypothetical protein A9Q81_05310 [Gammaproteobacteria bacterium 42_54_T18]